MTAAQASSQDFAFIALQNAYRPHAGLMRLRQMEGGGHGRSEVHEREAEALVTAGALFGFHWHDALWIPMFQFEPHAGPSGPSLAAAPQRVVAELGRGFDGWALASWFVQPNSCLASRPPIECLDRRLPDVLEAARVDRFLTTG